METAEHLSKLTGQTTIVKEHITTSGKCISTFLTQISKTIQEVSRSLLIVIAGDDDKHLEMTQGINPGKEKAMEAASAVNGFIILPTFAPKEQSMNPRQFSDFNDLANHSKLGFEGVKRQLKPKIEKVAKRYNRQRLSQNSNVIHIA